MGVGELNAAFGKAVDMWRFYVFGAITFKVAIAKVVGKNYYDIGILWKRGLLRLVLRRSREGREDVYKRQWIHCSNRPACVSLTQRL